MIHLTRKSKPKPSKAFETYWRFAAERQEIFYRRLANISYPWTEDKVLLLYKFTNAYRSADRVSQYLIRKIIYKGIQDPKEVIFRILLFKIFNKIETWKWLERHIGVISWEDFDFTLYSNTLSEIKKSNKTIYSGAYIMASGKSSFGYDYKHENHLKLLQSMMASGIDESIASANTMKEGFEVLKSHPTIGDFLAYQYISDINYSEITNFSELEFVKAGPGAKDGIRKCFVNFGDYSEEDIIRMMTENQEHYFQKYELDFKNLWGRQLQLIDCQNLFCEVDKYSRIVHPEIKGYSNRARIKQKFIPSKERIKNYWFPPKWGINSTIEK